MKQGNCKYCGDRFYTKGSKIKHQRECINNNNLSTCKHCEGSYESGGGVKTHELRCSKNPDKMDMSKQFDKVNQLRKEGKIKVLNQYALAEKLGIKKPEVSEITKKKIQTNSILRCIEGKIKGYRRANSVYLFEDKEIACETVLENSALKYFDELGVSEMKRSDKVIKYFFEDVEYIFKPSFEIVLHNINYLIETKAPSKGNLNNELWKKHIENEPKRLSVLEKVCKEMGYVYFWYKQ